MNSIPNTIITPVQMRYHFLPIVELPVIFTVYVASPDECDAARFPNPFTAYHFSI